MSSRLNTLLAATLLLSVAGPAFAESPVQGTWAASEQRRDALMASVDKAAAAPDEAGRNAAIDAVTRDVVDAFWSDKTWASAPPAPARGDLPSGTPKIAVMPLSILKNTQAAFSSAELMDDLAGAQPGAEDVVVQVVAGRADMASVATALQKSGHGELVVVDGSTTRVSVPLLVSFGAALVLDPGSAIVLDSAKGAFLGNSGTLVADNAIIEGTAAAPFGKRGDSFRSFVVSTGKTLSFDGTTFKHLGYPGVYTAGLTIAQTSGTATLSNSTFDDVSNVRIHQSTGVLAIGNRFHGSDATQMTVSASKGVVVRENVFWLAAANGLSVTDASTDVDVAGNVFVRNGAAGLVVGDGSDVVKIADNAVYGNTGPGIGVYGSKCVEMTSNLVLANGKDGFSMRRPGRTFVGDNRIYLNAWNGVSVRKAKKAGNAPEILVSGNLVSMNRVGIASDDGTSLVLDENMFRLQSPRVYGDALQSFGATVPVSTTSPADRAEMSAGCSQAVIRP